MSSLTKVTFLKTSSFLIFIIFSVYIDNTGAVSHKHGYFAKKLDEYYSTIKCVANILEGFAPEYNTLMVCCGVWMMHDWLGSMVLDNCYDHNYHQVQNLTQPFIRHMEENCYDYPRDSFNCKLMIITPIFILTLILVLMIMLSICAIVTCFRLKRLQKYHEYQTSQGFDSAGTEETTDDDPKAIHKLDEKKVPIDV